MESLLKRFSATRNAAAILVLILGPMATCGRAQNNPAVQASMAQGEHALHAGQSAVAEESFRKAIASAPQLPEAWLGLGMTELREGKFSDAEEALSKAIDLQPATPGAHLFLGIAQYQLNELSKAVDSLQQAVNQQPQSIEALTWLGIVQLGAGHPELATGPLDAAFALNPRDANILDYRGRAHTLVARQCFQKLYDLDPASWHVHRALGEMSAAAGQPEQAITEYKASLVEQPNNPDLYEALGDQQQRASQPSDAIQSYEQELKLNPQSPIALYNLGKLEVQQGDPAKGVEFLRRAIEARVPPAPAYHYLGAGLAKMERYQDAAEWLEKSLASEPSNSIQQADWYELMRVYPKLNRASDAQHAVEEFKKLKAAEANAPRPTENLP